MKEGFSSVSDEVEQNQPVERHLLPNNFLSTWLERGEVTDDKSKNKKKSKKKKSKAKKPAKSEAKTEQAEQARESRLESLSEKLRNILRGLVGMETVLPEDPGQRIEGLPNEAVETLHHHDEEAERLVRDDNVAEGLLLVSDEARRRYRAEAAAADAGDEPAETETAPELPPELLTGNLGDVDAGGSEQLPARAGRPESDDVESTSEIYRRKKREQLEREVRHLKKDSKSMKGEQAEVRKQQKEFERKLEKRQKSEDQLRHVVIPQMEKSRENLRRRLNKESAVKSETERHKTAEVSRTDHRPPEVRSEYHAERVPKAKVEAHHKTPKQETAHEAPKSPYSQQLEALLKPAELAPRKHELTERELERRHEVKDVDSRVQASLSAGVSHQITGHQSSPISHHPAHGSTPVLPSPLPPINHPTKTAPKDKMYKQAVTTGIWSGVTLALVLLLWILLMR